jgi:hypothetical protein
MMFSKRQILILFTAAVAGSLLYFYFDPELSRFFPACPLYRLTGIFCPGCGSQRAFHDLIHGHPLLAAEHNLLFIVFLPLIVLSAVLFGMDVFLHKKASLKIFTSALFTRITLVVIVIFWVLRNVPVEPFIWLAP